MKKKVIVAATQLKIILGDVEKNLQKCLHLVGLAAGDGAEIVVLPEFCTSGMAIHPLLDRVPHWNRTHKVLEEFKRAASHYNVVLSGSFLQEIGNQVYNSIFIIEPSREVFIHNKDIPTQFENAYYRKGDNTRQYKNYGVAFCWEMLRSKTLAELGEQTNVILAGSCWWDLPLNSPNSILRSYNHHLNFQTPQELAR